MSMILAAGMASAISIGVNAQTQPGASTLQTADTIKVTGCLKSEKDVPGLKPNVVERARITEDDILSDVTLSPDSKTAGLGLATMYEIEGIAESEHLNQQIEVTRRLSRVDTGAAKTNRLKSRRRARLPHDQYHDDGCHVSDDVMDVALLPAT
jgi:hypothetical protein